MTDFTLGIRKVPTVDQIRHIEDSRNRLIAAGARLILDGGLTVLATGLSPDHVTRLAGRTRRVFYDHFETKEDFVRAVCAFYLTDGDLARPQVSLQDSIAEMMQDVEADLVRTTQLLTVFLFDRGRSSEGDILRTIAGLLASDEETQLLLAQRVDRVEFTLSVLITTLMEQWGLHFRDPWTAEKLGCVLYGLADGMFRRAQAGSTKSDAELFALATLSLLPMVTERPSEAPSSVFEQLDRISVQISAVWREQSIPGEVDNAHQRVVDAFVSVLNEEGAINITLEKVSHLAGVSEKTILSAFGDVHGVLAAALEACMPSLQAEADFDITSESISLGNAIERHLLRCGQWVVENPMLVNALVVLGASGNNGIVPDATMASMAELTRPLVTLLKEGQRRGEIAEDADIVDAAQMATEVTIGRGGAMPGFNPAKNAALLSKWFMKGLA